MARVILGVLAGRILAGVVASPQGHVPISTSSFSPCLEISALVLPGQQLPGQLSRTTAGPELVCGPAPNRMVLHPVAWPCTPSHSAQHPLLGPSTLRRCTLGSQGDCGGWSSSTCFLFHSNPVTPSPVLCPGGEVWGQK